MSARTVPGSKIIDQASAVMIGAIGAVHRQHGVASAGLAIEGYVGGISAWLQCEFGPEVAYDVLQRSADLVAERVIRERGQAGSGHCPTLNDFLRRT